MKLKKEKVKSQLKCIVYSTLMMSSADSGLQVDTETPTARNRRFEQTESTCNGRNGHREREQDSSGSTFNETGVISQASVGEDCTSDYKKNDQHDDSRDVFTLCFEISFKEEVPASRDPILIPLSLVCSG